MSAVALVAGQGALAADDPSEQAGVNFAVDCYEEDGTLTCVLKVTGLPDPLQDDATVTLFSEDLGDQQPNDSMTNAVSVSADVGQYDLDVPRAVTTVLEFSQPRPAPAVLLVPDQPPKSL
jgi:hypothetical protein